MLNVNVVERRAERSDNLYGALESLLRAQRQRGGLDLMVLVTADGVVVAFDGPPTECEELAAYAPLLARGQGLALPAEVMRGVTVYPFPVGQQDLVLAMRGGCDTSFASSLAFASMEGITRILRG